MGIKTLLTRQRLVEILQACRQVKVGVIGDFTLDAYWYVDMTRAEISRETPLFARPVVRETYSPGGAANVAWNLADLGVAEVHALTVLGDDWRGSLFRQVLEKVGVSLQYTRIEPEWTTPLYGKVVLMNQSIMQEDPRLDFVNTGSLPAAAEEGLLANLTAAVPGLDALVVADYQACGVFSPRLRTALSDLAQVQPRLCCVADSRDQIGSFHSMILKPNETEAARLLFPDKEVLSITPAEFDRGCLDLHTRTGKPLFVTQGERGCLLYEAGKKIHLPAVQVPPPIDPVGAGDTFIASLAASLAAGAEPHEAGCIANLAAAVTVRMLHMTGTASQQAILSQYEAL